MAEQKFQITSGFYDAVNKDRLYTAEDMNRPYKRIISEGVFATPAGTPSTDLQVISAASALNIIVKKGEGLLGGRWFESPSDLTITVPANNNVVPRRDSVILQVDKRQSGRIANVVYREGVPNSNPQVPDINTVNNVIELRLANIYVAAGANYIGQDAIVDLRGSSECNWITSLIKQVDTSTLFEQFSAAYWDFYNMSKAEWRAFMMELSDDLTVNTNILTYESHYVSPEDGTTEIPINIASYNKDKDVLIVRINRLFASEGTDYVISNDSSKITLTKDVKADNNIDFLVLQSVIVGDTETLITEVQRLSTAITNLTTAVSNLNTDSGWINFTLESGALAFDDNNKPAIRKFGNQIFIRGAIKNLDTLNVPICTLPANMRPAMTHQYDAIAYDGNTLINCVLEVRTTGSIYLVAKSGTISNTSKLSIATNFIVG